MMLANMKSPNALSGLIPVNCVLFWGLVWIRRQTESERGGTIKNIKKLTTSKVKKKKERKKEKKVAWHYLNTAIRNTSRSTTKQ